MDLLAVAGCKEPDCKTQLEEVHKLKEHFKLLCSHLMDSLEVLFD